MCEMCVERGEMAQEELDRARQNGGVPVPPEFGRLFDMLAGRDPDGQAQDGMDTAVRNITAEVERLWLMSRGVVADFRDHVDGQDPDAPAAVLERVTWVAGYLMLNQQPSALAGSVVFLARELEALKQTQEQVDRDTTDTVTALDLELKNARAAVAARDNALTAIRNALPSGVKEAYHITGYLFP